jgi:hypothetical protein
MRRRFLLGCFLAMCLILPAQPPKSRRILGWKILIVEGQGAINFRGKAAERKFVVRVQEEFGAPGKGLPVTFTLPLEGPGGSFKHSGVRAVVTTDADGYAVLRGFRPNKLAGQYVIEVSAPVRGTLVKATIQQTNAQSRASIPGRFLHVFLKHRDSGDAGGASP